MHDLDASPATAEHNATGFRTYADAVARGLYERPMGGLKGKYDNVRTYWEDRTTRAVVRPFVDECDRAAQAAGRRIRVLDLGCGAGQGYELLTRIDQTGLNLGDAMCFVLPAARVGHYLGLDLSEAMVEQGRTNYAGLRNVDFRHADLRHGIAVLNAEPSFDIYFSSYGALSHLDRADLRRCLVQIVKHAAPGAFVVLDLLGRYSLEWPGYWNVADEAEKVRPYSMSYLYDEAERRSGRVETFNIRFWTGEEIRDLCRELSTDTGVPVEAARILDRSIFVGRHVDAREYGCRLPPLRSLVNRLYKQNHRTRVEHLRVKDRPVSNDEAVERFFETFVRSWNRVIDFTLDRLTGGRVDPGALEGWSTFPVALQVALRTIDRTIDAAARIDVADTRANIVEPQLAYVLQRLEHELQQGLGCGHGLVAVLRIGGQV
jgi:SAM-dependent methyltransferase